MLRSLLKRFTIGLGCALVVGLMAVAVGEAGEPKQEGPVRDDCNECHGSVVGHWQESAHGQAAADPIFQEAWQEQGSPPECLQCHVTNYDPETGTWEGDGIACATCHFGQTGPHPETPMPTDPSSRLCGSCHIDTHAEWQTSAHGEGELTCVRCHNPHTTSLKVGNMKDLCGTCHTEEGHFYDDTGHAQAGLQCIDCHLRVSDSPIGEGHGQRLHTFRVDLETCTQCHGMEMHFPTSNEGTDPMSGLMWSTYASEEEQVDEAVCETISLNGTPVIEEPAPQPAKPFNYLIIAAVGMGFGMAITPFAEGWYRRFTSKDRG